MAILIRDNETGRVFEYGTDQHHALVISDNGGCLTFENLQNGGGSLENGRGGYSFVMENGKTPQEDTEKDIYDEYTNIGGVYQVSAKDMAVIKQKLIEMVSNEWGYEGIEETMADIFAQVIGKQEAELGDEYKVCPFCGSVIEC